MIFHRKIKDSSENNQLYPTFANFSASKRISILSDFLTFGYMPGIKSLAKNPVFSDGDSELEKTRKYLLEKGENRFEIVEYSEKQATEKLLCLLEDAILELGQGAENGNVLLSGGLDSSALVACGVKAGLNICATTLKFQEQKNSELDYAKRVAQFHDIPHEIIEIDRELFKKNWEKALNGDGDIIRSAGQIAFIGALSGKKGPFINGAASDEGLFGYDFQLKALMAHKRSEQIQKLLGHDFLEKVPKQTILHGILREKLMVISRHRQILKPYFNRTEIEEIFKDYKDLQRIGPKAGRNLCNTQDKIQDKIHGNTQDEIQDKIHGNTQDEILGKLPGLIGDKNNIFPMNIDWKKPIYSMTLFQLLELLPFHQYPKMAGISERIGAKIHAPFGNFKLQHFFLSLPDHLILRGNRRKYILAKAMEGHLPQITIERQKSPLQVPIDIWLSQDKAHYSQQIDDLSRALKLNFRGKKLFEEAGELGYFGYERIFLVISLLYFLKNNDFLEN